MYDLAVIHPPASRQAYGPLSSKLTAIEPPIWCRIIAAHARERGHSVQVIDAEALGLDARTVADRTDAKVIAIVAHGHQPSASTQMMPAVYEVAHELKWRGRLPVIIGGHPSALPRLTATESGCLVCDGEGPLTVEALIEGKTKSVPGLVWEVGGALRHNRIAPLISADELEGSAWDLLPMNHYRAHTWQCFGGWPRTPYASIYTSFGCPFRCSFCMINAPFHANQYRARSPDRVIYEIEHLFKDYGVRTFKFADEMFVLRPSHYLAICEKLSQLGLGEKINIWAYARVDTIKENELKLMRDAGIRWLALGVEAADTVVRDGANKSFRRTDIISVVRAIQAAGIKVIGNFMFGLPDDDEASMQRTLDLALEALPDFANFYSTMAYPGSALFPPVALKNRQVNWSAFAQHSYDCTPLGNKRLSPDEVLRFRDRAFKSFFTDDRYLDHVRRHFGNNTVSEIESMTSVRLPRRRAA